MKQWKLLLLLSILLMLAPPAAAHAEIEEISYQVELDYPPYKYIQNGYLTGFDIDLTNMIFDKKDYRIQYSTDRWDNVYSSLLQGDIEIAGLVAVTEGRKQEMLFSQPVFRNYISIYARQSFKEELDLKTLGKYTIGVGNGQYSETVLNSKVGISQYIEYETVPEALEALAKGEIDLLFENQGVVDYLIVEQGLTGNIIRQMKDLYPRDVAYAISKSAPELVPYINARLERLQRSGAFEELYQHYFFDHSDYYKNMIQNRIIFGAIILFCVLGFGVVMLRMYIDRLRRNIYSEQQFFKDVIEHSEIVVWAVQGDRKVVRYNKYAERMTGIREQEVLGKSIEDIEGLEGNTAVIKDLLIRAVHHDYVNNVELKLSGQQFSARYYSFRTALLKGLDKQSEDIYVLVGVDIDERKLNELRLQVSYEELESTYEELAATEVELQEQFDKLQVSERRFRLATEGSGAYMWEFDWETGLYNFSERWYKLMGYTEQELNAFQEGAHSIIHPDDQLSSRKARQNHLLGLTPLSDWANC